MERHELITNCSFINLRNRKLRFLYSKYIVLIFIAVSSYGCSKTTYSVTPFYGYDYQENSQLIVAKFQNAPNDIIAENATRLIQNLYSDCNTLEVIPYDTVQNIFYKNISYVEPIWQIDVPFLVKLYEATRARYLLVGKVLGQSSSTPPLSIAERYSTGQLEAPHSNWIMLEFTLYDLASSTIAFQLHTRTKAGQYNYKRSDESVLSMHAPINLLHKAFDKSSIKLTKLCQCK